MILVVIVGLTIIIAIPILVLTAVIIRIIREHHSTTKSLNLFIFMRRAELLNDIKAI